MASSPRMSRYRSADATTESDNKDGTGSFGNSATRRSTGLMSEYTSKRLEELRLRRAESESSYADYKSRREAREKEKASGSVTSSHSGGSLSNQLSTTNEDNVEPTLTTSSSGSSFSDYKARREAKEKEKLSITGQSTTVSSSATTSASTAGSESIKSTTGSTTSLSSLTTSAPKSTSSRTRNKDITTTSSLDKSSSIIRDSYKSEFKSSKDEDECVGFATLPEQVHRKAVKRGFDFTLLVVGESGLGKSTMINSLLLTDLYKDRKLPSVEDKVMSTVQIKKKKVPTATLR